MGQAENDLFELLQTKRADALETNEDASTVGTTQLYADPKDRVEGEQTDSPWGEAGPKEGDRPNQAYHHTTGAWEESKKDRRGVIDYSFDSARSADKADQALIAENFEHGSSGDFTAHSTHLQGKSVEKISHPRTRTLQERVVRIVGRF